GPARSLRVPLVGLEVGGGLLHRLACGAALTTGEGPEQRGGQAPFVGEGGERDGPAAVEGADEVGVGYTGVGEEHLVERGPAVHLPQGSNLHARLGHGQGEEADAVVLGRVTVGGGQWSTPSVR